MRTDRTRPQAWLFLFLLLCFLGTAAPARAAAPGGRFAFESYGLQQGLGNLAVWKVVQDHTGFVWVGTEDGLYRFDGRRFKAYGLESGLPSTFVESIHQESDGTFWVGTYTGLARWNGRAFEAVGAAQGLPAIQVTGLGSDSKGNLWVGTPLGPYLRPRGGGFSPAPLWPGGGVTALWADPRSATVWAASWGESRSRILRRSGEAWDSLGAFPDHSRETIQALAVDGQDRVWARSLSRLWSLAPGAGAFKAFAPALPGTRQRASLYVDRSGRLWVTTDQGLYHLQGGRATRMGVSEGLPKAWGSCLLEDREGSLWVGGSGLFRLQGGGVWRSHTLETGLPDEAIWTVWRDRSGSLYVGTDQGLAREAPGGWKLVPGTAHRQVRSVVQDRSGALYLSGGPDILRLDPVTGACTVFGAEAGVVSGGGRIFRLLLDPQGTLWAATEGNGLLRGQGQGASWSFRRQSLPRESPQERITDLHLDAGGRLWVAGSRGLAMLEKGRWRRFSQADGLRRDHVAYVTSSPGGDLLLAYFEPMGVTRAAFDAASGRLTVKEHLNSSNGLSSDKVFLMGEDAHGNLWVGSGMGVDRVTGSQVEHFSQGDGLVNDDTNSMSFLADPNGDVWVGTSLGLARFDASAYKGAPEPPATAILGFRMGGQEFFTLPQHPVSVPHQSNTFEVSFAGLSFIRGGDVKHQVRLVGLEPEWRLTDDRTQRYPALAPGWYTFEVRARVGMGPWGPVSRIVFQVRPAWWQAWWFRGLLALGASCLVLLVIRWRLAALEARNHQLEEMVTRRTFEVQTKAQELERVNEALRNQSLTDPLTGLRNRRFLGVCMPEDVARVNRVHRDVNRGAESRVHLNIDLVFIMVDIDHFKSVNDQHGHGAGDRVLQQMAEILRQATRETDTVVRWGGEEFLVVARNAARRDSVILAERIRSLVEAHPFDLGDGKVLRRTCSVGFTFFPFLCAVPELFNWEQAIDLADHCLYAAKHGGRNAWVGVYPREDADPEDLRQRLPMEIEELVESGRLTAVHHERPGFRLAWEIRP